VGRTDRWTAAATPQSPEQSDHQHRAADQDAEYQQDSEQAEPDQGKGHAQQRRARPTRREQIRESAAMERGEDAEGIETKTRRAGLTGRVSAHGRGWRDKLRAEAGDASIGCGMNQDVRTSLNDPNGTGQGVAGSNVAGPDKTDQSGAEVGSAAIARLDAMLNGELIECQAQIDGDEQSLIVLRDGDAVRAWMNICPHAGRSLGWAPGKFLKSKDGLLICAVHGASFELQRGECVAGPCKGQSLREVAVAIVDGEVRV
jgi:nitrite reductase/ring-hydroxylating ferredoxin subunit